MRDLFQNVLTASFHGSIVIVAVILLRLVLKKAPKKFNCFLWLLVGIRLLMPFEIRSDLSLQPDAARVVEQQSQVQTYVPDTAPMETVVEETPVFTQTVQQEQPARQESQSAEPVENGTPTVEPEQESTGNWAARIPYIWLSIACCFAIYSLFSYLRLRYQVQEAIKIPGGWECDRIETAFILGFVKPKIYIPMGMPENTRKHILAHERTHLEKGDHWFKMIGFVALAIHWFNPLVWLAYVLLCKDIEMACDERVVQFMDLRERKEYSAALLSCSTNRAHFAACPVAFGEVSVKERIKSVLNYRRPSFWISLVGVIAIIFVAVCLVTSPTEKAEAPAAGETTPTVEETVAEDGDAEDNSTGFASTLSESEIAYTCEQAIEELKSRESYFIREEYKTESSSEHYGSDESYSENRRYGENMLSSPYYDGELIAGGGSLYYDGKYAGFMGDKWAWSSEDGPWASNTETDVNAWLDSYSPAGKMVTFPEGTGVVDGDTVSMFVQWTEENPFEEYYIGTFTFTFHDDGTLASVVKDYTYQVDESDGGGEVHYIRTLTVMEESADQTAAEIEAVAEQTVTAEELEEYRLLQDQVTEVPSNKTSFDKNFALGSAQMGWKFAKGEWFFKFGAEDVTPTSAKLVVETSCPYGDNTISSGTIEAGAAYFIEELVDGVWVEVPVICDTFETIQPKVLGTGSTQTINWEANYGKLSAGFYRIGNYYTFTSASGETDVQVAYAKFRLYDPNQDLLLNKCRTALDNLLASDSYHLYSFDWMTEHDYEYYLSQEVWKNGKDYLEVTSYPMREDMSQMMSVRGSMWRDGKYYGLEWSDEPATSDVTSWWLGVDGYVDDSNFSIWTFGFEWYDSQVALAYEDGNKIHILEFYDYSDKYEYSEVICTFDDDGNLKGLIKAYLPTLNCAEEDKVINEEMVVFDTGTAEIAELIGSQDVTTPMPFSYEEDVKNNPDAKTEGFRNTTAKSVTTAAEALALADKESTMPQLMEFVSGYCQSQTYYDAISKMWKVHLFWWQHDTAQTIYMNDQGITQMVVSVE